MLDLNLTLELLEYYKKSRLFYTKTEMLKEVIPNERALSPYQRMVLEHYADAIESGDVRYCDEHDEIEFK